MAIISLPARLPVRETCLTRRQIEVLELAMGGRTDKEVGQRLGISEETVRRQFTMMFNRTGMGSKIELLTFVMSHPEWIGVEDKIRRKSGNKN